MADYISQHISKEEFRPSAINWLNTVRAVRDGYRAYRGLPHGIQKDAIQNGWDARENKNGASWNFTFELVRGERHTFFTMTDEGTTGLTGRVLSREELYEDLPSHERWGRFENMAFTKDPSEETLGSRGRGKFIFVSASSPTSTTADHVIMYDSLREDNTYRFGVLRIDKISCSVAAFDGDEGRKKLVEMTKGVLKPLAKVGTRVIILDPCEELINAIDTGEFCADIEETWWEIIQEYNAKIVLRAHGREQEASMPPMFVLPREDTKRYKVWIKENIKIPDVYGNYKIRTLHIVSDKQQIFPEHLRGVSIQRGGMKVCPIETRYMPKQIADTIYGYITLNSAAERQLLADESIEHYSYDFRRTLPGAIKRFVEDELSKFAREKLGWGADVQEIRERQQKNAERRALLAINKLARIIGLIGLIGAGPSRRGGGGGGKWKEIRVRISEFEFPRKGDLRVNYGETLKNISVQVINDCKRPIVLKLQMQLRHHEDVIRDYVEQNVSLGAVSESQLFGPYREKFSERKHPEKGKYTVVARIVSLTDIDENVKKGTILDEKKRSFYLEEDPPQPILFEKCEGAEFPSDYRAMGEADRGEGGGFIFYYNMNHPAYKAVYDMEYSLAEYLFRLMAQEICRIDSQQGKSILFEEADKETPDSVLRKTREIFGDFMYRYHAGEI